MKRNRKESPEISAGSMADVAFLLLIFFLVVATIDVDKGIVVKLPPWCEGPECNSEIPDPNVFSVALNMNDKLLVEGEPMAMEQLKPSAKKFIRNLGDKGVFSLINDRSTSYDSYLGVYNEIRAAYNEIWESEAQARFGTTYEKLKLKEKKEIRKDYPLIISEAEPTDFALQ